MQEKRGKVIRLRSIVLSLTTMDLPQRLYIKTPYSKIQKKHIWKICILQVVNHIHLSVMDFPSA